MLLLEIQNMWDNISESYLMMLKVFSYNVWFVVWRGQGEVGKGLWRMLARSCMKHQDLRPVSVYQSIDKKKTTHWCDGGFLPSTPPILVWTTNSIWSREISHCRDKLRTYSPLSHKQLRFIIGITVINLGFLIAFFSLVGSCAIYLCKLCLHV